MDCRYDFTFLKNMKTEVPPSYLTVQTIKFREISIIWCPPLLRFHVLQKVCFLHKSTCSSVFATYFQQFACFCRNLHVSSRSQCIMWFSMVLKGRFTLDYGIELENFLNGLLLLDEIRDTSKLPSLSSLFRTILLISRFSFWWEWRPGWRVLLLLFRTGLSATRTRWSGISRWKWSTTLVAGVREHSLTPSDAGGKRDERPEPSYCNSQMMRHS